MKNKRLRYVAALCVLLSVAFSGAHPDDTVDKQAIHEQTFLVYRRYYFVARLDKTIKLLAKMYHDVSAMQGMFAGKQILFDEIVPQETYLLFTHKQIRHSLKEISHTRSLKPLFMVWDSFKSYKSLRDDLLVEDFSKEIFIITRNTIDSLHKHDPAHVRSRQMPVSLEERLDVLADMAGLLENGSCGEFFRRNDMGDIHLAVHTDEVAFRFYCIRRLRNALDYLLALPPLDGTTEQVYAALQGRLRSFQNTRYTQMSARQGLAHAWDGIVQYKYIESDRYVHDFAVFALMILHCQLTEVRGYKTLTSADLIAMQHRIEQLPLEEILQTIDLIVKQVHNAVDHYHKSGLTFDRWIRLYWWAPTAICTTVAIKCFLLYYKNFRTS